MSIARSTLARFLAALVALTLIAGACGDDGDDGGGADTSDTDDAPADGGTDDGDDAGDDGDDGDGTGDGSGTQTNDVGGNVGDVDETVGDRSTAVRGGTLRVAVEAESDGLNPVANNFAVSAYLMGYQIFDPLFYIDADGNWFPWLAESATPIGDGSSWQIKVREDVMFHDGTELDADALIAGFEATLADPIISLAVRPSYPEENRIEKIDDYTVQFNLIRPTAHFPVNITSQLGMVGSPTWIEAAAADPSLDQRPVGTGPFRIDSREQDEMTRLVRNEDYWQGTDDIYLDAIEFYPITDTVIAAERVSRGDFDVLVTSDPEAQLTLEAGDVNTVSNLLSEEDDIMMNTSVPPFDDIRVRQALTFATDRQGYVDLIAQGTKPLADTIFHPDLIWHNPDIVQEGNEPDRAAPLVAEYCAEVPDQCTDGRVNMELQYSGPSVTQTLVMDVLSEGWKDYFNITRQELLQDDHITEVALGQWQVVTWRQFGAADPDNEVVWLECATATGSIALNWPRVCDPARDELLYEQRASDDLDRRVEIWKEIAQNIHDSYAYVFLTHTNWVIGFGDRVENLCGQTGPGEVPLACNRSGSMFFHNTWLSE